jgi:uncharacterized protein (TIGR02246 family)
MKAITLSLISSLFAVMSSNGQINNFKTKNQLKMETEQISKNILKSLEDGWNHANGTEYAKQFADTSEFVTIRGELHKKSTRQYLAEAHQGLFMSIYKDSKVVYQFLQAMPIDKQTILVNAQTELDAPTGPLAGKSSSTITLILVKSADAWKIRAFQNTLVAKR